MKFSKSLFFGILLPAVAFFSVTGKALAATITVANEAELQAADSSINPGDVVLLTNDFEVSERVEFYSSEFTLDGDGYTIGPNFSKTDNTNNSALVFFGEDVEVKDLTIDGSLGENLHGLQAYQADNVIMENVTSVDNDYSGIVVNGSTVTVVDVYTDGNGWHGINVDQGSGVTNEAILTVEGTSFHGDLAPIYVDHYLAGERDVIDVENQYNFFEGVDNVDDRLYVLDSGAPDVMITDPTDGEIVSGLIDIKGTIDEDYLWRYYLVVKDDEGNTVAGPGTVYQETDFEDSLITMWDTTSVDDGEYTIVFAARDVFNQRDDGSQDTITITVDNSTDDGGDDDFDDEPASPQTASECKKGGWEMFTSIFFKNQGDCVSHVKASENAKGNRK